MIQGLIALNVSTYVWKNWHGTLLSIAVIIFSIAFNTVLASRLPMIEGAALVLHIVGFLAIIIPLWVMGPPADPKVVLLEFVNNGGWPTVGLSSMIGLLAPMAVLVGYDCSVHMCECIGTLGGLGTNKTCSRRSQRCVYYITSSIDELSRDQCYARLPNECNFDIQAW